MRIKINELNWTFETVEENDERLLIDNDEVFGITHFKTLEIFVVKNVLNDEVFKRTIRHELTHAYLYSYGFIGSCMDEEYICNFMEIYGEKIVEQTNDIYEKVKSTAFSKSSPIQRINTRA